MTTPPARGPPTPRPAATRRASAPQALREVFGGGAVGVDPDVVRAIARQIAEAVREGIQVAVVVGGGNFFRGAELQQKGMDAPARRLHGHARHRDELPALQDFLEKEGVDTRVQTAIAMGQVAEPYIPAAPSATSRRAGSSSSAPVPGCRTSPPTR